MKIYFSGFLRKIQTLTHWGWDKFATILQMTFSNALNENVRILHKISLKFVPKVQINNIPALVQKTAWHQPSDKQLLNQWCLVYWCVYASLGLNELRISKSRKYDMKYEPANDLQSSTNITSKVLIENSVLYMDSIALSLEFISIPSTWYIDPYSLPQGDVLVILNWPFSISYQW